LLSLHWQQAGAPSQDLGFLDRTAAVSHKTGAWVAAHGGGGDTEAQPVPFSPCGLIILTLHHCFLSSLNSVPDANN
jgi:hypothetical protein